MKIWYHARCRAVSVAAAASCVLVFNSTAPAVVLEQRWQPGQQLGYDVTLNGSVSLQMPAGSDLMLAGLPLDIDLRVQSQTVLDVLSVDDKGSGTVAVRIPALQLKGEALGQSGEFTLRHGQATVRMNDQILKQATERDWSRMENPRVALKISKQGRFQGLVPLDEAPANTQDGAASKATSPPVIINGLPIDIGKFVNFWMVQSMPAWWPDRDVQAGDTWKAELRLPLLPGVQPVEGAEETPITIPPVTFQMALRGEEEVAGRKVQHVALENRYQLTREQATTLYQQLPAEQRDKAPGRLSSLGLQVKGDLWLDPASGQMVKLAVNIESRVAGRKVGKDAAGKAGSSDSSAGFEGTFAAELRKVSYSSAPLVPAAQ